MPSDSSTSAQGNAAWQAGLTAVPLFHAAWMFAVGIAVAQARWLVPGFILAALIPIVVLCAVAALRAQRMAWLPVALLWLLLGAWCAEMQPQPAPAPDLAALSDGLLRTVEGTVVQTGSVRNEAEQDLDMPAAAPSPSERIDLRVSSLEVVSDTEDVQAPAQGEVRLTVRWPAGTAAAPIGCGEHMRVVARLLPPEVYHDPGAWNRQEYLLGQDITSTAGVSTEHVERLGMTHGWIAGQTLPCLLSNLQHASSARLLLLPAVMRGLPAPLRLSRQDAAMLAAMVTGDRTYLTHALRAGFERTGSFHMLVVSGLHLAIVAGCILWAARKLRLPRTAATLATIAGSLVYALFTGFATPVQRSLWMVALYLIGRLFYRERAPMNAIGFAALCLLAANPRSLFDASFQMTLLAVVAVGAVAAPLLQSSVHPYLAATRDPRLVAMDAKLPPRVAQFRVTLRMIAARLQAVIRPLSHVRRSSDAHADEGGTPAQRELWRDTLRLFAVETRAAVHGSFAGSVAWAVFPWAVRFAIRIWELIVVSCVVELAMALPMAVYFHRITLFALPVNLLILPLLVAMMPAALLTLLAVFVWPQAAVAPAMAAAALLHIGVGMVRIFGSMALGNFRIATPLPWQAAAFCTLLAAAIALASLRLTTASRWPRRAAWAALLLAAVAAVAPRPVEHPRHALLVEALDVGQGDSLLLITPEGKTLLVDGGGFGGGPRQAAQDFDIGEEVVSPALWARGIRRLDVVALSHAHSDHMGGLPAVLDNFHPAEMWVGNNPRIEAYNALLDEAGALHVRVRALHAGDALALGSARVQVLAPAIGYRPGAEPANDDSMVLHVAYGRSSVLLEGDAEAPVEESMMAEQGLESTLLKVGHHGSITSTRPAFLARVAPRWAIISCGLRNRYGHPRPEVLAELEAAKARTYSTDINGAMCFQLDGKDVRQASACGGTQGP